MNQEQNNLNPNNFNTQGNNGISNNQPLNNQSFNQGMGFNQQPINPQPQPTPSYQQPTMQEPTPQPMNKFEGGNASNQSFNSKPPKKMNLGLIIGIIAVVAVVGVGIVFGSKLLSNGGNNNSNNGSSSINNSSNSDIVYYDSNRDLKEVYTFDEATNQFAFLVNTSTLIFKENEKVSLDSITQTNTIYDELMNPQFAYKHDNSSIIYTLYLGESNSSNLKDFVNNFKNGILSDKTKWEVENINIIESTEDYVFASWQKTTLSKDYEYYFAKKIGNKVFYSYKNNLIQFNDEKKAWILNGFKELFNSLSLDDGTEPYIYDKIINVPLVLNKKIMDYNLIFSISNGQMINDLKSDYMDGSISFDYNGDYINLEYGATGHYNKINWSKNLDSKIKYCNEDSKITLGIKDGSLTQVFEFNIYSDNKITNVKEFDAYIDKVLNND